MLLFSGCAFGLSGPDPDRPRSQAPKCDTGKSLVALDGVVAATAGVIAISVAGDTEPAVALLPLSIGAIYAAGAIRGNSNVNKCRAAMAEYESYSAARETIRPQLDEGESEQLPQPRRKPLASRETDEPVQPVAAVPPPTGVPATVPVQAPAPLPAPVAATPPVAAAPPVATPPPAAPPPAAKATKKQPAPKQEPTDDWSDFWREVQ